MKRQKTTATRRAAKAATPEQAPRSDDEDEQEEEDDLSPVGGEVLVSEPVVDVSEADAEVGPETHLAPLRDPVDRFLAEARRYARLDEEEEKALGGRVRELGDMDAARRLVVHNLRLVVSIAYQYRRAWANILDLFQEGSVGLMEAVKRWEPDVGTRFGSYAAYWIRAYILRFLMTNSRLIHVGNTRAGRKLFFRLERERRQLLAQGFEPTPKLLAARLDVDEHEVEEVSRHLDSREVSLAAPPPSSGGDESYSFEDRLASEQATPEEQAAASEMSAALARLVSSFEQSLSDDRELAVWREHLAATEPVPLAMLGQRFGVSKQRMGQIAEKLKQRFREQLPPELGADIKMSWLGET